MKAYCQSCQKAAASVHVTEMKGGKTVELHLCEECAESQGIPPKPSMSMLEIFQQLVEKTGGSARSRDRSCTACKMTFHEFKAKGRFGCAEDYDVFLNRLIPLLERIHGASEHVADPLEQRGTFFAERAELRQLRRDLNRVVHNEEYEEAARIRDRIQSLETTLGTSQEEVADE
jgi:protein arginine kinase activator